MKRLRHKRKGFSLIELVVVMAIVGILLVVMAPNYQGFIDKAKTVGVRSDAKTIQTMISLVEVSKDINDSQPVSSISTMEGDLPELANLKEFIAGLKGDSEQLRSVSITSLPAIVETGKIAP